MPHTVVLPLHEIVCSPALQTLAKNFSMVRQQRLRFQPALPMSILVV